MAREIPLEPDIVVGDAGIGGGGEGTGYLVGSGDVWGDGSDATYAEIAGVYFGSGNPQFTGSAQAGVTAPATPIIGRGLSVFARLRVAAVLGSNVKLPRVYANRSTAWSIGADPTGLAPTSPTWVDIPLEGIDGAVDDLLENADSWTFTVYGAFYSPAPSDNHRWRIYEAELWVDVAGDAPPCRLFPRGDGLGVGSGRIYPPPRSQQRSGRRFGYY